MELSGVEKLVWIMPEERDEVFSRVLINRIKNYAEALSIEGFLLEVWEHYEDEENPHYHLKVSVDLDGPIDSTRLNELLISEKIMVLYSAATNDEEYSGRMDISFSSRSSATINQILVSGTFLIYDEVVKKYYPEWKTRYITIINH